MTRPDIVGILCDCVKVYAGSQLAKDLAAKRPQSLGQKLGARAKHWFKASENIEKEDLHFDEYDVCVLVLCVICKTDVDLI